MFLETDCALSVVTVDVILSRIHVRQYKFVCDGC